MSTRDKQTLDVAKLTELDYFVVTCYKRASSSSRTYSLLVTTLQISNWSTTADDESINTLAAHVAETWANNDALGQNNGFSLTWRIETDEQVIKDTILRECNISARKLYDARQYAKIVNIISRAF